MHPKMQTNNVIYQIYFYDLKITIVLVCNLVLKLFILESSLVILETAHILKFYFYPTFNKSQFDGHI